MNEEEKFDAMLDHRLDEALAKYSDVTPGPGLETRILATVRESAREAAKPAKKGFYWVPWIAVPVGLALALWVISLGSREPDSHIHNVPGGTLVSKPALSTPHGMSTRPIVHPVLARKAPRVKVTPSSDVAASVAAGPKLATFPAPSPLSEQERLLLGYLQRTPREEVVAQSRPDEPPLAPEINEEINEQINAPQGPSFSTRKSIDTK